VQDISYKSGNSRRMDHLDRYASIIPDFERFQEAIMRPIPPTVRINALKTRRDGVLDRLDQGGVKFWPFGWYPFGLRLEVEKPGNLIESLMGHIHVQEEISMVPALVLDPKPGETVLDLCAAPGSKTTQISQIMENRGVVVANDPSPQRIVSLRANCERMGALNVMVTKYDGRHFPKGSFDRVLVDAPCTGQGMARKDPSVLQRWSLKRSLGICRLQASLLKRALYLTRPGGTVVYSTCTFAPEENEGVVSQVSGARLVNVEIPGLENSPGIVEWGGKVYGPEMERCARYYPHQNDTGGFFVSKFIRE